MILCQSHVMMAPAIVIHVTKVRKINNERNTVSPIRKKIPKRENSPTESSLYVEQNNRRKRTIILRVVTLLRTHRTSTGLEKERRSSRATLLQGLCRGAQRSLPLSPLSLSRDYSRALARRLPTPTTNESRGLLLPLHARAFSPWSLSLSLSVSPPLARPLFPPSSARACRGMIRNCAVITLLAGHRMIALCAREREIRGGERFLCTRASAGFLFGCFIIWE